MVCGTVTTPKVDGEKVTQVVATGFCFPLWPIA